MLVLAMGQHHAPHPWANQNSAMAAVQYAASATSTSQFNCTSKYNLEQSSIPCSSCCIAAVNGATDWYIGLHSRRT